MMKGKTPSAAQKKFHTLLCNEIGCIACFIDSGRERRNTHVSVHHIDGRTKAYAHWYVLGLCAGHHQDGSGAPGLVAVHPWKARFEDMYGSQMTLLSDCIIQLRDMGHKLPAEALAII